MLKKVEVPREAKLVEESARLREGGECEEGGQGRGSRKVNDEQDEG